MQLKHKYQPQINKIEEKRLSPGNVRGKMKKNKDGGIRSVKPEREIIPIHKVKHHLPSKSALQSFQHVHYNSPNMIHLEQNSSQSTNPFTFTQIIRNSTKYQQVSNYKHDGRDSCNSDYSYYCKEGNNEDSRMSKTPLSIANLTHNSGSFSNQTELTANDLEFSRVLKHKLSNMQSQSSKSIEKSMRVSTSKSPLRVTNAHKLNNTPKLKDRKYKNMKEKKYKQIKTFTQMLSSQLIEPSSRINQIENINLQCSQKIYKFIKESEEKDKSKKNKSNLLSTGIINISQPFQNSQSQGGVNKLSRDTLTTKVKVDRIISEDNIQQFKSDSPQSTKKESIWQKIDHLRNKIQNLNTELTESLKLFNQQIFISQINQNFNPELANINIFDVILELTELNTLFQGCFQQMMKQIEHNSQKVYEDIANYIKLLNESKSSMIDWINLDDQFSQKQIVERNLCRNQMMKLKIDQIQKSTNSRNDKEISEEIKYGRQMSQIMTVEAQIAQQIKQLSSLHSQKQSKKQFIGEQIMSRLKDRYKHFRQISQSFNTFFIDLY